MRFDGVGEKRADFSLLVSNGNQGLSCEISDSDGGEYEDDSCLGYSAV
jgi:hypothetical protein